MINMPKSQVICKEIVDKSIDLNIFMLYIYYSNTVYNTIDKGRI